MQSKVGYFQDGTLAGILGLKPREKLVLSTGHEDEFFRKFLKDFYPGIDLQVNKSIPDLLGDNSESFWSVRLRATEEESRADLVAHAMETYNDCPKLCFGSGLYQAFLEKLPASMSVVNVATKDQYLKQKNLCRTKTAGIVVLEPIFAVGANLRFQIDAEVLILQHSQVVKEDID